MKPQELFYKWKEKQGLPLNGNDITNGDTVQHQAPSSPGEKAIKVALAMFLLHSKQTDRS